MKRLCSIGLFILANLTAPTALAAQTDSPSAAVAPDRLAAARKLIDLVMPPAHRDTMLDTIVRPMMAMISQSITQSPEFNEAGSDPRVAQLVTQYLAEQQDTTLADLKANMPAMLDAMARAYARRFTVAQLNDLSAFFVTPSGRAYIEQAPTIMTDPDVIAWQRQLMTRSMGRIQQDMKALTEKVGALQTSAPPKK